MEKVCGKHTALKNMEYRNFFFQMDLMGCVPRKAQETGLELTKVKKPPAFQLRQQLQIAGTEIWQRKWLVHWEKKLYLWVWI